MAFGMGWLRFLGFKLKSALFKLRFDVMDVDVNGCWR